jgi:rsbT antagonist protein RsbS
MAIIDITGVPTVDTLTAQHLLKTVAAARLMGADCVISGIRPQIAQTMVHLGVELTVVSKATLADAFALALARQGRAVVKVRPAAAGSLKGEMDRIPILKLGNALLVTIQVDMHDRLATALEEDLTARIVSTGARGVLIDISALEVVDSFIGRMLDNIAAVSRILDADTVVVGMRPAVAITLVELGLSLTGVKTALNVERGMRPDRPVPLRAAVGPRRRTATPVAETLQIRSSDDVVRVRQRVAGCSPSRPG